MPSRFVTCALALAAAALATATTPARAASLPEILVTGDNAVWSCATPGRLMAFLEDNNSNLRPKFSNIATEYMRYGEKLGVRWDYAFFQMLVETGYLKFTGDVNWRQNNFAGLGATGGGVPGESFPDVGTGVRAHLEHVLMYTGTLAENAAAKRTRDVYSWGVLDKWRRNIQKRRRMTFTDLASKWAPGSRGYPRDIGSVANRFRKGECRQPDPKPELVAIARGGSAKQAEAKPEPKAQVENPTFGQKPPGTPANTANSQQAAVAKETTKVPSAPAKKSGGGGVKVLNKGQDAPAAGATAEKEKAQTPPASKPGKDTKTAAGSAKCKVWQASYGGTKAIIIKAKSGQMTNYTVLDVNAGSEKREADAYIAAYAKGGSKVGEYSSSNKALEKAFELCPEG